ncbi:MAG: hypothetical protein ACR2JB_07595 [Bryobacteraceae bacterium]
MDNYALLDLLLKAEGETEVDEVLKKTGYFKDDSNLWQPFGGFGMNLNQINNQQSDATAALVEKLINSIDAVLMAECYQAGIDPKGPDAPHTMAEAVERLFKVKDGRLENLTATERTKLAERIHFVATGTKREPCYLVVDRGEGQTPDSFKDTFLSLTKQNKDDIPFVQGRFNCGGTGVLPFCGEHKYQLIVSRRHASCPARTDDATKDLWGFTIVRRQRPAPGRKSSMYVYLAPGGSILTFARPSLLAFPGQSSKNKPAPPYAVELPHGTCIKLYNYRWKKKTLVTTDGRYELERYLHSVSLPLRISETRDYKANYYSTTLSGILAHVSDEGTEDDSTSKFEKGLSPAYGELNLPGIGRLPYKLFLLKETYEASNFPHGVYFTLNGQVHGDLPANFISSILKFDYLSRTLLVSVDCTEMDQAVREDFLMASRDRVRRNEAYDYIYSTLREELREHAGLREHNAQRRKKRLDETLSKEESTADYFQELLKSDPTLASILGIGGNIIGTTGPSNEPVPYHGRKFPTYFRIAKEPKNGLTKLCPLNRTVRVEFETDADNDYFERPDCPGSVTFDPPNLCVSSHLWDGVFTTKFQMPFDAQVGDTVNMTVSVTDIQRDNVGPFLSHFIIKGAPEAEDTPPPPPGSRPPGTKRNDNGKHSSPVLAAPDIREVRREKWADPQFQFDEYSALKIMNADEGHGYVFFVNMDNRFLINELHKTKEEEAALVKHWFKYGIVLSALGILKEIQRLEEEGARAEDEELEHLDMDKIGRFCGGLARVVVPIIRALHKGPAMLQASGANVLGRTMKEHHFLGGILLFPVMAVPFSVGDAAPQSAIRRDHGGVGLGKPCQLHRGEIARHLGVCIGERDELHHDGTVRDDMPHRTKTFFDIAKIVF